MRPSYFVAVVSVMIVGSTACTITRKSTQPATRDPLLAKPGGVVVISDVCVQRDALGDDDDYFVIAESQAGGRALGEASRKYIADNGVQVVTALAPFVCGARVSSDESQKRIAGQVGGAATVAQQPFGIAQELEGDPEYLDALASIATHAFQRATSPKDASAVVAPLVSAEKLKAALAAVQSRTQAAGAVYIGVAGYSQSSGKAVALGIGRALVGMATGVATGGVVTFIPGQPADGRVMGAALVDLQSGDVSWTNLVRAGGDPVDATVIAEPKALSLLLGPLVNPVTRNY